MRLYTLILMVAITVSLFARDKKGTAQESDEGCILGGFLEDDDFSLSGRPNIRFRRKWAEFAALLWKWRAAGGREE